MSKWSSAFRDSRWQKKRLEIMERDEWTCRSCGASGAGVTLNVHHAYYESGKAPWEYPNETLVTWCEDCHKERHEMQKRLLSELAGQPIDVLSGSLLLATRYPQALTTANGLSKSLPGDRQIAILLRTVCFACMGAMTFCVESEGLSYEQAVAQLYMTEGEGKT